MARVAVLIATYNGSRYLSSQIDSILAQDVKDSDIFVSDDGSSDSTLSILGEYSERLIEPSLNVFAGPRKGFAWNFISLLSRAGENYDFYAFSDQDDVWECDKLSRALSALGDLGEQIPAVYCARTRLVDEAENEIGFSPLFSIEPSFKNALVQSIGGGNTMVMNRAARDLLVKVPSGLNIVSHDWLAYLLVTACGGRVIYDAYPCLRYRQHGANLVGANNSFLNRLSRMRQLLAGRFKGWSDSNIEVLNYFKDEMTPLNRSVYDAFLQGREGGVMKRLVAFKKSGVFRQSSLDNLGLWLAMLFKRI